MSERLMVDEEVMQSQANEIARLRAHAARLEGERDAARERFAKVQFWEDKIDTLTAERDAARGSLRECVEELALEEDRRIRRCEAAGSATGHGYSESHRCSGSTADLLNRARATIAKVGGCWRCGNAEQPGFLVLAGRGGALIPCPYCRPGKAVEWMADAAPRKETK